MTAHMEESPQDAVVLVMGITGVGKSTFVSQLTGDAGIGHDLSSYTQGVGLSCRIINDKRIYLIDTPGFNDTWRSDVDILKEIAFILAQIRRHGLRLAGVLYLHRITDNRVAGSTLKNFSLVENLCGPEAAARLFLVTTMWNEMRRADYDEAETREKLLSNSLKYWGRLCQQGSQLKRWNGTSWSALEIIQDLLQLNDQEGYLTLQIQKQLADGRHLIETTAGQELFSDLLSKEMQYAGKMTSLESTEENQSHLLELQDEIRGARESQEALKINASSLLLQRQYSYKLVFGLMECEIAKLSDDLNRKRTHISLLQRQRKAKEERVEQERRDFREKEKILNADDRAARRRRQSLDRARRQLQWERLETNEQFQNEEVENEQESAETTETIRQLKKRHVLMKNLIPLLGVLGGTSLAVAGAVTGIIPLAGAGVGLGFSYASKIQLSRKTIEHTRDSVRDPVLAGGQGAASAALD